APRDANRVANRVAQHARPPAPDAVGSSLVRRLTPVLAVLTLAAGLAACSPSAPEEDGGPAPSDTAPSPEAEGTLGRDATEVEPTWSLDLNVIGQPSVTGGVAVVLTRARDREVDMVGVDVATGEQLWSHPWSPGSVPAGFPFTPATSEDSTGTPVALATVPTQDPSAETTSDLPRPIVALDARTGEELHRADATLTSTPVGACDDGTDLCFTPSGAPSLRVDLTDGSARTEEDGTPPDARSVGSRGLFATNDRPGEQLGVQRDGAVQWQRPIAEIFGDDLTTNLGWSFTHVEDAGVYVGYLLTVSPEQQAKIDAGEPFSNPSYRLAGFREDDGEPLWTAARALHDCLPVEAGDAPLMVRCVLSENAMYGPESEEGADATARIEGFDPATGETAWSVEASPEQVANIVRQNPGPASDGTTLRIDSTDGPVLVDIATGTTEPTADDDVFACQSEPVTLEYAVPWVYQDRSVTDRRGGSLLSPCGPDGAPAPAWTVAALQDTGDAHDGTHVIAVDGALQGFTLED
ncbi:PQQ-like beta-propeller repeat protein, partial [Actinotalea sp. C106]|uniref:PQQ-like beta-propeller repeat protein n=1 Tax=Actinotalea sp. C106 TaxID=2908644 RepID=UPI00202922C3